MTLDIAGIEQYCEKFLIPTKHFLDIISDLKVLPMIRGKGFEYFVSEKLESQLDPEIWEVTKYNTNPQRNSTDADLVVKHLPSGVEVILECKTAVRGSFKLKGKICKNPHFRVKCHKSRSNTERSYTNDRYFADEFNIIISSPANAFIGKGDFSLIDSPTILEYISNKYGDTYWDNVIPTTTHDIRAVLTTSIAEGDNTVPRSPIVEMENDPNWVTFNKIEELLMIVVTRNLAQRTRKPTISSHLSVAKSSDE
ncbi:TPA: hypothetical protein QCX85_001427 [Bacillus toyonensis]|nr:hypothetical protein [Bacillus toyonensis]